MRGAVAVVRQRRPPARCPPSGGRAALEALGDRVAREVVARERHVAIDGPVDPRLRRHREIDPDVVEQRLGRPGEVVPVRGESFDARLARAQDALVVRCPAIVLLDDVGSKLAIDGTTQVVHPSLPGTALSGSSPLPWPGAGVLAAYAKTGTCYVLASR